jgi:sterol desaturase/sphingolipid hydroxylase (fatty acid hydroxylase superfamily)
VVSTALIPHIGCEGGESDPNGGEAYPRPPGLSTAQYIPLDAAWLEEEDSAFQEQAALYDWVLQLLPWGQITSLARMAAILFGGLFVTIYVLEWLTGGDLRRYRTRVFAHDVAYFLFYRVAYTVAILGPILAWIKPHVPVLFPDMHLAVSAVTFFLATDFTGYWIHRWQHSNRFLWAFHSVHHAPQQLTFLSSYRLHVFDQSLGVINILGMSLILGAPAHVWMPYLILYHFFEGTQHADLKWRFGPCFRLVVSPVFHAVHHSADPAHHHRNFGKILSLWDFLFGTAADARQRPQHLGLDELHHEGLWDQWASPFRRLAAESPSPRARSESPSAAR